MVLDGGEIRDGGEQLLGRPGGKHGITKSGGVCSTGGKKEE